MTKRRNSTPYQQTPTSQVRALMRDGWRRCDAEAIDVVRLALTHAGDPKQSRTWAVRAAKALATEPVMLGAIHRLASEHETAGAALRLLLAAPTDQGLNWPDSSTAPRRLPSSSACSRSTISRTSTTRTTRRGSIEIAVGRKLDRVQSGIDCAAPLYWMQPQPLSKCMALNAPAPSLWSGPNRDEKPDASG